MKNVSDWPYTIGMNIEFTNFKFCVITLFLHNLVTIINFLVTALQFTVCNLSSFPFQITLAFLGKMCIGKHL